MSSKSKRQQTMAKRTREQTVRDKRVVKQEKKAAAALARAEGGVDTFPTESPFDENGELIAAAPAVAPSETQADD
jgi:hypothetical protein